LLVLLRKRDRPSQSALFGALRNLRVDRRLTSQVVLELGAKGRHEDVLEITENLGWKGDEVAELLGTILKSPDAATRRRAVALLERSGTEAAPALGAIVAALNDSDKEVRYLAVRTLETMGASSPEILDALQVSVKDEDVMVQTAARRALRKLAPENIAPREVSSP
jgi:HEAT repeat protein